MDEPDRQESYRCRHGDFEWQALSDPRPRPAVYCRISEPACGRRCEVSEASTALTESECPRREICAQHQGVLLRAHDLVWRGLVAQSRSRIPRTLPSRTQSPGFGQPTDQSRSGPVWESRRGPAAPAPGRHAELLLPCRRLTLRDSGCGCQAITTRVQTPTPIVRPSESFPGKNHTPVHSL